MISSNAPGALLKVYSLKKEVISCEDAATAKGILLANELKTLILKTDQGLMSVSLPSDFKTSLRKIKSHENFNQAYIASIDDLNSLKISPGTVTPLLEPLWSMKQLLDKRIFEQEFMSTNNGTLNEYVKFDPQIMLKAPNFSIGNFSKG